MSMSVGGIGGYAGINDYWDMYAGRISAEDAADMADAVDFDDNLQQAQDVSAVAFPDQTQDTHGRVSAAEESAFSNADHMRGEMSRVMEDMMVIQGSLWGFSARRVIPLAGGLP